MPAEITVPSTSTMPKGYGFLKKGDVYKTSLCRRMTHEAGKTLYVVNEKGATAGLRAPRWILSKVFKEARETKEKRKAAVERRDTATRSELHRVITRLYPNAPMDDVEKTLSRSLKKRSGRVGRTGTLDLEQKARLAVRAHIRHVHTNYDKLMRTKGMSRGDARDAVQSDLMRVLRQWQGESASHHAKSSRGRSRQRSTSKHAKAKGDLEAFSQQLSTARSRTSQKRATSKKRQEKDTPAVSSGDASNARRSTRLSYSKGKALDVLDHFSDDEEERVELSGTGSDAEEVAEGVEIIEISDDQVGDDGISGYDTDTTDDRECSDDSFVDWDGDYLSDD